MDKLDVQMLNYQKNVNDLVNVQHNRNNEVESGVKWEDVKEKGLKYEQTECAICQCAFDGFRKMCMLQCGHIFHRNCTESYERYTLGVKKCPVCREAITGKKDIVRGEIKCDAK